jgi:hypothetical protein
VLKARIVAGLLACVFAGQSARAELMHFEFSQLFPTGSVGSITVTGSFDGDLDGTRITNITDIYLYRDGHAFRGNGALYTFQFNRRARQWENGGYLSTDGSDNNIMFIDTDYGIGDASFFNFFYSVTGIGNSAFQPSFYRYQTPATTDMHITRDAIDPPPPDPGAGGVPEPSAWALLILGFGAVGAVLRRRAPSTRIGALTS